MAPKAWNDKRSSAALSPRYEYVSPLGIKPSDVVGHRFLNNFDDGIRHASAEHFRPCRLTHRIPHSHHCKVYVGGFAVAMPNSVSQRKSGGWMPIEKLLEFSRTKNRLLGRQMFAEDYVTAQIEDHQLIWIVDLEI
ncbi:MAG: hypothetical protein R3F35_11680 [Myxococcota bacterium]